MKKPSLSKDGFLYFVKLSILTNELKFFFKNENLYSACASAAPTIID